MDNTSSASTLFKACQNGSSLDTLSITATVDYGMDFHAKADPEDIFKCYQNVLTQNKITCEDLHEALLANKLNEVVLAECTDDVLRARITAAGGIYNAYMYMDDKEAGKPIDVSIEKKQYDFVMKRMSAAAA